jgi:hypothetical protein
MSEPKRTATILTDDRAFDVQPDARTSAMPPETRREGITADLRNLSVEATVAETIPPGP